MFFQVLISLSETAADHTLTSSIYPVKKLELVIVSYFPIKNESCPLLVLIYVELKVVDFTFMPLMKSVAVVWVKTTAKCIHDAAAMGVSEATVIIPKFEFSTNLGALVSSNIKPNPLAPATFS
jgi:hypothetical protein